MKKARSSRVASKHVSAVVRARIESAGDRVWCYRDFRELPVGAVAQALSRMSRAGTIERVAKGAYYRSRTTALGKSRPSPAALHALAVHGKAAFPSGVAAANLLGFTSQQAAKVEIATTARSLSSKLLGTQAVVYIRRPKSWSALSQSEAALLDFLRRGGVHCELSPRQTLRRMTRLLSRPRTYERVIRVAYTEPPRVRAMLGALGERMGKPRRTLSHLKASLNPLSRFDFGVLRHLPNAARWQAKHEKRRPTA